MNKRNIEAIYPLSPMQQGMLFHTLYAPDSGVYFEQLSCTLRGEIDVPAFERAWQRVAEQHPILRTSFVWKRLDRTLQVVHRHVTLPLEKHDWRGLSPPQAQMQLDAFLQAQRSKGFDLARPPLMRLALIRIARDLYYFVWSHHHILLDGWSLPLILRKVLAFYQAFSQNHEPHLPPPRPYRDYITWLQKQDIDQAETFWRHALHGFTAPTPLGIDSDRKNVPQKERDYGQQEIHLPATTTAALQALARQHHLTLNTLLQGAWALLLSRYSGRPDVLFGTTVSGRPADLAGAETMIGLFINTLPFRVRVPPNVSLISWLKELQAQQAELRQYEYSPLVRIQEWSDLPRGTPLFESILVFENYPLDTALQPLRDHPTNRPTDDPTTQLTIENIRFIEQTNYPLTVVSGPGREMELKIAYDGRRFDAAAIARMLAHLKTLLEGIVADPEQRLATLPLLTPAGRQQQLVEWNATRAAYPRHRCVHQLFQDQAARTPHATALVFQDQRLTYAGLNRRANRLAHYLQKLGAGPETLVGLCVERSPDMIVGLLGILKAGAAYLPLDPAYPRERLAFMLKDTQVPVLLTQKRLIERLPVHQARVIQLDADWQIITRQSDDDPVSPVHPENLAYVIYTSGSTGQPKGTLLQHRGLGNFVNAFTRDLKIGPNDHILQFASFGFDASVAEILAALLSGAALHLASRETLLSLPDLTRLLQDEAITVATLPPAILRALTRAPALRTLVSVGEACSPEIVAHWAPGRRFFNGYGPTETTIGATWGALEVLPEGTTHVSIGRPIANTQIYLLDPHLRPVPLGLPGELHIGGDGLARGYLNRPALTARRFIPHPFSHQPGARLYKTGDLARYRPDGNLEFLGRLDHQVKIRGYRVELGEIEALLNQHPALQMAAVLDWEDGPGNKRLVAYVVPAQESAPTTGELRAFLQQKLPDYMLPSNFVVLQALPLTASGKVDRRALPAPDGTRPDLKDAYVPPHTPEQEILAGIWSHVLGVERVGVHDSFFELGGHSLLATRLASRVRQAFQVELPLRHIFETPTVAGLADIVRAAGRRESPLSAPPIEPLSQDDPNRLLLSFAQQRLWFLDQLEPASPYYNVPSAVRLTGPLNVAALELCLNEIVRRHQALRTTFATVDGRPVPAIAPQLALILPLVDLRGLPQPDRRAHALRLATEEAQRPFDLARRPLLRATLLQMGQREHIALFTMHHIVSDGWSMGLLIREIATLYGAFAAGKPSPLPELPVQYADFAAWQRAWLQGEVLQAQLDYWKQQLSGSPPMLELPTDRPRPAVQSARGAHISFALPHDLSAAIHDLSQRQNVTLFMTLLAAFQALLYRYTGQHDICVGTPIANRTRRELEGLIGFFVNTLVMRTDLSGNPTFEEILEQVREVALDAYAHQDLPFEMLVEELQPDRDLSHTPLFQVMLVLDNENVNVNAPEGLTLPGLSASPVEAESGTAKFDLTLSIADRLDGMDGYIEYNTDLFDETTIERMIGHLQTLLHAIAADPAQHLSALPLLTPNERRQLLFDWNATAAPFPQDRCIHHLFEARAQTQPSTLALTFKDTELTYHQLNRRANQLAHHLQKLGVGPETVVGLCAERFPDMVVAILAILKAGGAYLPLDPTYPPERLAFMLHDSQTPLLLTQQRLIDALPLHHPHIVCLDTDWPAIARQPDHNPASPVTPDHLAYVIYTSGSTGQPKGTMLQHRGLCNLTTVQRQTFHIDPHSRILQFSAFSYDASVWETFMALANGATLCLARAEVVASGPALVHLLRDRRVTNITLPPSILSLLPPQDLPALQTVISAGEACTPDLVAQWAPGRYFFNAYGPTETTVCPSMYRCDENDPLPPPIGRPIANAQLYVLDPNLQPVPVGVPGELHVGGVGLARGYLNRPALTAANFIPHPFSSHPGDRLYKTGDLVRYRPDGNLEFLGRIDHLVKVRGFRIELGEIETALVGHPDVRDGVVVVRQDTPGDKRLVAYLLPATSPGPGVGELRTYLRQTLPEYMVPSAFVTLDTFPLSPSGKVDRRALPPPDKSRPELERAYVAPRDETEAKLAGICAALLDLEQVGIHDSFFDLGGHSLLATQFISRLRETFHVELPLRALFESPTIAELAGRVKAAQETTREIDQIAQMLEAVSHLSDDQVQAILDRKMTLGGGNGSHE